MDKQLRIFDLEKMDAEPQTIEGHSQPVKYAIYSKDGTLIISGGGDATLK